MSTFSKDFFLKGSYVKKRENLSSFPRPHSQDASSSMLEMAKIKEGGRTNIRGKRGIVYR